MKFPFLETLNLQSFLKSFFGFFYASTYFFISPESFWKELTTKNLRMDVVVHFFAFLQTANLF